MSERRAVLVLGHGAGGDRNDPMFRGLERALPEIKIVRFDFPYRKKGRGAPGSQAESEKAFRETANTARIDGLPLYVGGKSYGGRIATHIVADGFEVDGVVLLSYPLHPPGRLDRLRDSHLPEISVPMLFIQGTKDAFATPDLLDQVVARSPTATLFRVDGGDHSLRVRGQDAKDVISEVARVIDDFLK